MSLFIVPLIVIVYILGIAVTYKEVFQDSERLSNFEKIWFSFCWVLLLPLYAIHWIHNKM